MGGITSSFQAAVIDVLSKKLINAAIHKNCKNIGVAGGVSANMTFVKLLAQQAKKKGIHVFAPDIELCGDNAAMIAGLGWHYYKHKEFDSFDLDALNILLEYNKEDVINLKTLKDLLL